MEKSRCLRRDRQLVYVDYDPINFYASVASHVLIRMQLSMAVNQNILLEGAEIANAYLYVDLDIPIFMEQHTNSTQHEQIPDYACRLNKSVYVQNKSVKYGVHNSTNH